MLGDEGVEFGSCRDVALSKGAASAMASDKRIGPKGSAKHPAKRDSNCGRAARSMLPETSVAGTPWLAAR